MNTKDFFAALAIITEQVMAQRGANFDSAFEMCNGVLTDVTDGAVVIEASEVDRVVNEVKSRLGLLTEDKGGAR